MYLQKNEKKACDGGVTPFYKCQHFELIFIVAIIFSYFFIISIISRPQTITYSLLYQSMHKICIKNISKQYITLNCKWIYIYITNTTIPYKFTTGLTLQMIGCNPTGENLRHGIENSCDPTSSLSRRRLRALEN